MTGTVPVGDVFKKVFAVSHTYWLFSLITQVSLTTQAEKSCTNKKYDTGRHECIRCFC